MIAALLIAGAVLLMAGAELLVRGAARIAVATALPSLVVGLTIVAFGTSAPELAVSIGATFADRPAIAIGNVVGSNIFNVLFILGLSASVVPLVVDRQLVRLDAPVMLAASVVLLLMALDARIDRAEGVLLFSGLLTYTWWIVRQRRPTVEPVTAAATARPERFGRLIARSAIIAVVGLALLVLGARWFVSGAVALARVLDVSEAVIGLTIIAAGTSLPELATSVVASIRGERDIAVGNIIGSNIFNILAIVGLCGILAPHGVAVVPSMIDFDIPVMLAVAVATLPVLYSGMRVSRAEGGFLLAAYAAYTLYLVLQATQHQATL
ncbi:MAG TPA: calcium/sodium antiporter [Longimicrobiales bacterium]